MAEPKAKPKAKKVYLNPFNEGVTYDAFLKSIKGTTIAKALKDSCTPDQIAWLETEIESFKNNK